MPNSVTTLDDGCFAGCTSLHDIKLSTSITEIPKEAFKKCHGLTSITLHEGMKNICNGAFRECNNLASIDLPSTTRTIDEFAFYKCTNLHSIYCRSTLPPQAKNCKTEPWNALKDNAADRMIYVPRDYASKYTTAYGWRSYADYIVEYDF